MPPSGVQELLGPFVSVGGRPYSGQAAAGRRKLFAFHQLYGQRGLPVSSTSLRSG
jgi:hypothetical protein